MPASWQLLYRQGNDWKPAETTSTFGVRRDAYNAVHIKPVETAGLRLEVQLQTHFSGGILEWKVEAK